MEKAEYQGEAHYKGYQYEPIKFITDMKFDFIRGNILKYLVRYRKKNGLQDLKKARNYAEFGHSYPSRVTSYGIVLEEILLASLVTEADDVLEDTPLCEREVEVLDEIKRLIVVSLVVCTAYLD